MSLNRATPTLDGITPSFADITVRVSAVGAPLLEIGDIKSINTASSVEVGEQRGASGGRVMKRTTGQTKYEAGMTLYYSGYLKMLRGLKALAPIRGQQRALSVVHFGIEVQFTPPIDDDNPDYGIYVYRIKGCRYTGRTINPAEGIDAVTVDVSLSVIDIVDVIDGEEVGLL